MPLFHMYKGAEYVGAAASEADRDKLISLHGWQTGDAPPPTPGTESEVRAEAIRRIDAVADPRTRDQLFQRALRLIMKVAIEGGTLTAEEQAEIAAGKQQAERIEVIQAAERALLAMDPIPSDFAEDRYWR